MAWLLILVVFWKPLYFVTMSIVTKNSEFSQKAKDWLTHFVDIIGFNTDRY